MTTRSILLLGCCLALTSCDKSVAGPSIRERDVAPSLSVGGIADERGVDGRPHGIIAHSPTTRAARAAVGARATGHADVVVEISPALTIASKYSFAAISITPTPVAPFAAKGELQGTIVRMAGSTTVMETVHADVDCMNFLSVFGFGDVVSISGRVKKLTRDGQQVPVTVGMQVVFTVRDNGEGRDSPPDLASFIAPIVEGRPLCQIFFVILEPNRRGNIQVRRPDGGI